MNNPAVYLSIILVFLVPIYGFPIAYTVSDIFAERPRAWELAKVVICLGCLWLIVGAIP